MTKIIQRDSQNGQAVVEYILMVLFAISLVAALSTSFRRSLIGIWGFYTRQISAACPGCPPNPRYKFN